MKNLFRTTLNLLLISVLIGFYSCQKEELSDTLNSDLELKSSTMNTFYSKTVPIGNGIARAWIQVNKNGDPLSVGINLSGKALMNLPDEPQAYVLELPKNKGNNFYTHVLFDWNPQGHEPPGIYDIPHFDFHFYTIPNEERLSIPPLAPPNYDTPPAAQYIPSNYFQLPGLVPEMGAHWADGTSPELQMPQLAVFTHTFIWGSYNGEFIFWEPMITRDYLMTQPDEVFPIPQPASYQKDGWYATDYTISYSARPDEYTVALLNLVYHDGE
jgi:hypothetical protein